MANRKELPPGTLPIDHMPAPQECDKAFKDHEKSKLVSEIDKALVKDKFDKKAIVANKDKVQDFLDMICVATKDEKGQLVQTETLKTMEKLAREHATDYYAIAVEYLQLI